MWAFIVKFLLELLLGGVTKDQVSLVTDRKTDRHTYTYLDLSIDAWMDG